MSNPFEEGLKRVLEGLKVRDYVFTVNGETYYKTQITGKTMPLCKRARIHYGDKKLNQKGEKAGIVFYCLGHARTSTWVEMGFSNETIGWATGHKSLESYRTYVKLEPAAIMRLVDAPKQKTEIADNSGIKAV